MLAEKRYFVRLHAHNRFFHRKYPLCICSRNLSRYPWIFTLHEADFGHIFSGANQYFGFLMQFPREKNLFLSSWIAIKINGTRFKAEFTRILARNTCRFCGKIFMNFPSKPCLMNTHENMPCQRALVCKTSSQIQLKSWNNIS